MKKTAFGITTCIIAGILSMGFCQNAQVHEHGYWYGEDIITEHQFDPSFASALVQFFSTEKATSIVDFGCGTGAYVKVFKKNNFDCEGYDGNPDTATLSEGRAQVKDLSEPFDLGKRFDWVVSLEVGEHLPKQYEKIFIENLHRHNKKGIVLSWALKGQGGFGHFNEQNNDYVKALMAQYGYFNDIAAECTLRKKAYLPWFKNTIMVFRKRS